MPCGRNISRGGIFQYAKLSTDSAEKKRITRRDSIFAEELQIPELAGGRGGISALYGAIARNLCNLECSVSDVDRAPKLRFGKRDIP